MLSLCVCVFIKFYNKKETLGEIWVYISLVGCFPRKLEYMESPLIKLQHCKKKEKEPSFYIALVFVSIFSPQINSVYVRMITVCACMCVCVYFSTRMCGN